MDLFENVFKMVVSGLNIIKMDVIGKKCGDKALH